MKALAIIAAISAFGCRPSPRRASPVVLDCTESELNGAKDLLRRFDEDVAGPNATPDALTQELANIESNRCFSFAQENPRASVFRATPEAMSWWQRGGRSWLQSVLRPASPWVSVPPDVIHQVNVDQVAPELRCGLADDTCGIETDGWSLRAEETWNTIATRSIAEASGCDAESERVKGLDPYSSWRSCIEARRIRRPTLPLGHIRAPSRGWVVVRGPSNERDPRRPCDDVQILSVETGGAFISRSCAARGRVPASRTSVVGSTSVDAIREALWMSSLSTQVQVLQPALEEHRLPKDIVRIPIHPIDNVAYLDSLGPRAAMSLEWTWIVDGKVIATGTLVPGAAGHAGDAYADLLWRVARASLRPGCPTETLPRDLSAVIAIDHDRVAELAANADSVCAPRTGGPQ